MKKMGPLQLYLIKQTQMLSELHCELEKKSHRIRYLQKKLQGLHRTNISDTLSPESLVQIHGPVHFYHCTGFTYDQFSSLCVFFEAQESEKI